MKKTAYRPPPEMVSQGFPPPLLPENTPKVVPETSRMFRQAVEAVKIMFPNPPKRVEANMPKQNCPSQQGVDMVNLAMPFS